MKLPARIFLGCLLLAATAAYAAATFRAEVQGDTILIYSTNTKPAHCSASVMISYKYGDGRRTTRLECNGPAPAEKDYVFCKRTNPDFVDLKIERPANGDCE
jgi:hypothetical protein